MLTALFGWAFAGALSLDEVLGALDARLPAWDEAAAEVAAAEAKVLSARGSFDPKAVGKAGQYDEDSYDRWLTEAKVGAASVWGPSLDAGHRAGVGDFPTYDGRKTGEAGELFVRAEVPVLDGLWFGEARVDLDVAQAMAVNKDAARAAKGVALRRKATEAYWKWVAAGQARAVEARQLALAEERVRMLGRQVEEGGRAALDLLDNERALYERKEALIEAEQKLDLAAIELSLWWRAADGVPQVPSDDALPAEWPEIPAERPVDDDLARASERPELRAVAALTDAAVRQRQRAGNSRLPDLAVTGEYSEDLASGSSEFYAGVGLTSSLLLRKERGSFAAAEAELRRLDAATRGLNDQVRAEILAAHAVRDTARQRVEATRAAAARADEVVTLERRRFELGGGDLFQLLLRESTLAKAQKSVVEAELALRLAQAGVEAAVGVGISP